VIRDTLHINTAKISPGEQEDTIYYAKRSVSTLLDPDFPDEPRKANGLLRGEVVQRK